ncbi:hypothetical protein BGZ93_000983 [Podila epicladia]|nr:hypothetical protein BGZ92_002439 [Podila epicladia]KAG0098149.1 hypothetical protein BGZ93_000983 [Podila epicladia]
MPKRHVKRRDLQHLQHMSIAELSAPRKLRERKRLIQTNTLKVFQDTIFSIPELRAVITSFLAIAEIRALVCVCRAWNKFWIPSLYQSIHVTNYKRTRVYPKVGKFGHYVQALRVVNTKIQGALHLIDHLPHLRRLSLGEILLSSSGVEEILSAVPDQLSYLDIALRSTCKDAREVPWIPESVFQSIARLQSLQSLIFGAVGMTLHVNDILYILKACPRLVSLELKNLKVLYLHPSRIVDQETADPTDPPAHITLKISDQDFAGLYVGRQLEVLKIYNGYISDIALLRLLGVDLVPLHSGSTFVSAERYTEGTRQHSLVHLNVDYCYSLTHRSAARILQDCDRLQTVELDRTNIATIELFEDTNVWPCASSIQSLSLDIKPVEFESKYYFNHHLALHDGVPALFAKEQRRIRDRLQSLVNLRQLKLTGYPIDFTVVEDMSFAKRLETARVELMARVAYVQVESQMTGLVSRASEWEKKQPEGWCCAFWRGSASRPSTFSLNYSRKQ